MSNLERQGGTSFCSPPLEREGDALLFEASPLPLWAFDPATRRFLAVNDAALAAYGYSRAEFLALTLDDIRPADDVPALRDYLAALPAERAAQKHWRHRRKDGSVFWVEVTSRAVLFQGRPARLVAAQDITERRQSEEALGQVMQGARCLIWQATVKGKEDGRYWQMRMIDPMAARRWMPIAVAPGQAFEYAWHYAKLEEDRERMDILSQVALREGWRNYTQEFRCQLADGSLRWLSEDVQIDKVGADEWHLVGVCTDITQRKQAEETLSRVMLGARCLIWYADVREADARDPDGRLVWSIQIADEAAARRWLPIAIARGQSFDEAWHLAKPPEDRERMRSRSRMAIRGGQANYTQEFRCRLADGRTRWLTEDVQIEKAGPGEWRLVGVCTDVTDRKQIEDSLTQVLTGARCLLWEATVEEQEDNSLFWDLRFPDEAAARRWLPVAAAPDEPFSEAWLAAKSDADKPRMDFVSMDAIRSGRTSYRQEFRSRLADGTVRWLSEDVQIENTGPKKWRLVGVCTDITGPKQSEAERERLLAEALERADRDPVTGLLNHRMFHKRLKEEAECLTQPGRSLAVALLDVDNFLFFNETYGYMAGDAALKQLARTLQETLRPRDFLMHYGGDTFALILPETSAAQAQARIQAVYKAVAALDVRPEGAAASVPLHLTCGLAILPEDGQTRQEALDVAETRLRRLKSGGEPDEYAERLRAQMSLTKDGFQMLDALVTAVDNKDRYTRRHSEDVMRYCRQIACQMGISPATRQTLEVAALLHDVGKIGIRDSILRKPGKLTDAEYEMIKQHPQMGAIMVGAVPGFEEMLDAVRHHHERWDGQGYPFGLAGQEIPPSARLMAVADAFSAMTTDRPYRKGMPEGKALDILAAGAGTQWDPECVAAFLQARSQ